MATLESIIGEMNVDSNTRENYTISGKLTLDEFLYLYVHADDKWKDTRRPNSLVIYFNIDTMPNQLLFIHEFNIIGAINIRRDTISFCVFKKGLFYFEINSRSRVWDGIHAPKCVPKDRNIIRGSKIGSNPFITDLTWTTHKLVISHDRVNSCVVVRNNGQLQIKTIGGRLLKLINCNSSDRLGDWVFITKGYKSAIYNVFTDRTILISDDIYDRYVVMYGGKSILIGKIYMSRINPHTIWYLDEIPGGTVEIPGGTVEIPGGTVDSNTSDVPVCSYTAERDDHKIAEIINRQFGGRKPPQRFRLQIILSEQCIITTPEITDQSNRKYTCLFVKKNACWTKNEIKMPDKEALLSVIYTDYILEPDYSSLYPKYNYAGSIYYQSTNIDNYFMDAINDRIHEMYSDVHNRFYGIEKKVQIEKKILIEEKVDLTAEQKKEKKKIEKDRRRNQRFQNKKFRTR